MRGKEESSKKEEEINFLIELPRMRQSLFFKQIFHYGKK